LSGYSRELRYSEGGCARAGGSDLGHPGMWASTILPVFVDTRSQAATVAIEIQPAAAVWIVESS
jgi:hypothetical protein